MPTSEKALDIRVAIEGSEPEIWRSLRLPLNAPLNTLHEAIQRAFGWENRHLHLFHPEGVFGEARPIAGDEESAQEMDMDSAEGMTVAQLLSSARPWAYASGVRRTLTNSSPRTTISS